MENERLNNILMVTAAISVIVVANVVGAMFWLGVITVVK
jgi:hypothetical protein